MNFDVHEDRTSLTTLSVVDPHGRFSLSVTIRNGFTDSFQLAIKTPLSGSNRGQLNDAEAALEAALVAVKGIQRRIADGDKAK